MSRRGLVIPTVSAIQDRNVQAAFQSIMSWARNVDDNYVARGDLNLPNSPVVQQVVNNIRSQQTAAAQKASAQAAAAAAEQNRRAAAQVVRNILQNSGTEPPVLMRAPVLFAANNSATRTYIGAGGIGGGVVDAGDPRGYIPTFGLDASDGSVFFGKDTIPAKQITFDATTGELTVGADVRINMAGYPTLSETYDTASMAYSNASAALSGLTAKLNKTAGDILTGAITVNNAGGFCAGTLTWDSNGNRTGGYGVAMTKAGLVGYDSAGNATFTISASSGAATFAGQLSAATGSFAGSLDVGSSGIDIKSGSTTYANLSANSGHNAFRIYANSTNLAMTAGGLGVSFSSGSSGQVVVAGTTSAVLQYGAATKYVRVNSSGIRFSETPTVGVLATEVSLASHSHALPDLSFSDTAKKAQYSVDGVNWTSIYLRLKDW